MLIIISNTKQSVKKRLAFADTPWEWEDLGWWQWRELGASLLVPYLWF